MESSIPLLDNNDTSAASNFAHSEQMAITTLKVDGMTCGACTSAVESAFQDINGVGHVSVSLLMGRAVVHHDLALLSAQNVAEMIENRGFDTQIISTDSQKPTTDKQIKATFSLAYTTTLSVKGMTCGSCTAAVEGGFKDVQGVESINVSLLSERAVVIHYPTLITSEEIAERIKNRGFDAVVIESKESESPDSTGPNDDSRKMSSQMKTTITIQGMTCGACTSAVENAVSSEKGLIRFNISLLAERAVVIHDPLVLSASKIIERIDKAGFDAQILSSEPDSSMHTKSSLSLNINVYGLPDATAAADLEETLRHTNGITSANVKMSTSQASVTFDTSKIGIRALVSIFETAGYNALLAESDDNNAQLESLAKTKEIQEWRRAFLISLMFAIPVMLISMIIPMYLPFIDFGNFELIPGLFLRDICSLILTIPVQFGIGLRFYRASFKSLKHRSPTMDVLIMLSTSLAFGFSIFAMVISIICKPHSKPSTVFETSTMLITFITLGRWLENRAKGQTSRALSRLMSLTPSMALIYDDPVAAEKAAETWKILEVSSVQPSQKELSGQTSQKLIPTELIEVGDIVCLRPGDKIPADGIVIRGESFVDESMVTGEALAIKKIKGQHVIAGTVNGTGWADFRVTRAGRDTQLSQIVKLVQEAQTNRAPIQRMADVVAGYFVPTIIILGLLTFVGWMILSHVLPNPPKIFLSESSGGTLMVCLKLCISVIVFACPCALGLSTPTAVMVGTGVGAENGILVKGGAALEAATKIKHVVFDKTGTLTMGRTSVAESRVESKWSSNEMRRVWWLVVGLTEMTSEHPIGKTIVSAAKSETGLSSDDPLEGNVVDFEVVVGKGVSATVEAATGNGRSRYNAVIGNAIFLRSRGIKIPSLAESDIEIPTTTGASSQPLSSKSDALKSATVIHVGIDDQYSGTIWLQDSIKPTAKAAVAALHRMGITTSLVTGDTYNTAVAVAKAVGIPTSAIRASVSPLEKQSIIAELQSPAKPVAMVGDGINDSPALATASVGIALSSGTDVAMEAADVVLMRPENLLSVPESLCLSKSIFNRIKMNLLWACIYNAIGIPFAMGLFLPFGGISLHPMAAGAAMAASSVSVVVSSLLLKFWKPPRWLEADNLEKELELGLIDSSGLGYRSRGRWWKKSSFTPAGFASSKQSWTQSVLRSLSKMGSQVTGKRIGMTQDEGYVPLQTVEHIS
ncbi:hypothetical protein FQN57_006932 [Myotisia sp. PD_48]|nr:hypothetical protein FQN57_006932 [Myotisia sp. PD_48]